MREIIVVDPASPREVPIGGHSEKTDGNDQVNGFLCGVCFSCIAHYNTAHVPNLVSTFYAM